MFAKLAEKLNSKLKNTEEEIEFKEYTKEEEVVETVETKETATVNASTPESNIELKVSHPESYADVSEIADYLLDGCTVVLNMEAMGKEEQLRMLDFLNGITYATGGDIKFVSQGTYIITPNNVDVQDER